MGRIIANSFLGFFFSFFIILTLLPSKRDREDEMIRTSKKKKVAAAQSLHSLLNKGDLYQLWLEILLNNRDTNVRNENGITLISAFLNDSSLSVENKDEWIELLLRNDALLKDIYISPDYVMPTEDKNKKIHKIWREKKYSSFMVGIKQGLLDVNEYDNDGFPFVWVFLQTAKLHKSVKMEWFDFLVAHNMNINLPSSNGITVLHDKTASSNIRWVKKLLKANADANVIDSKKWLPLHFAASSLLAGSTRKELPIKLSILKKLVKVTHDLNAQTNKGNTALHYVSGYKEAKEVTNLLIRNGADSEIKNNKGETAYHFSLNYGGNKNLKTRESVKKNIIFPCLIPKTGSLLSFTMQREIMGNRKMMTNGQHTTQNYPLLLSDEND